VYVVHVTVHRYIDIGRVDLKLKFSIQYPVDCGLADASDGRPVGRRRGQGRCLVSDLRERLQSIPTIQYRSTRIAELVEKR
jgi:hypothetical protein